MINNEYKSFLSNFPNLNEIAKDNPKITNWIVSAFSTNIDTAPYIIGYLHCLVDGKKIDSFFFEESLLLELIRFSKIIKKRANKERVSIEAAEKKLRVQLNYGGIVHDPADHKLIIEYRQGDLPDEIGQMRRLASAFNELADALEDK